MCTIKRSVVAAFALTMATGCQHFKVLKQMQDSLQEDALKCKPASCSGGESYGIVMTDSLTKAVDRVRKKTAEWCETFSEPSAEEIDKNEGKGYSLSYSQNNSINLSWFGQVEVVSGSLSLTVKNVNRGVRVFTGHPSHKPYTEEDRKCPERYAIQECAFQPEIKVDANTSVKISYSGSPAQGGQGGKGGVTSAASLNSSATKVHWCNFQEHTGDRDCKKAPQTEDPPPPEDEDEPEPEPEPEPKPVPKPPQEPVGGADSQGGEIEPVEDDPDIDPTPPPVPGEN